MGFDRPCSLNKEGEVEGVFRTVFHVNFDLAADEDEDSFETLLLVLLAFLVQASTGERTEGGTLAGIDVKGSLVRQVFPVIGWGGRGGGMDET